MIDIEKLNPAKAWMEKLANGINPLNDELVKDDDLINNVHISRCLFYVSELLGEINIGTSVERRSRKPFFLSKNDAVNIPISIPNGIANFVRLVNGYIPEGMKPLSAGQTIKWLRNEGLMKRLGHRIYRRRLHIETPDTTFHLIQILRSIDTWRNETVGGIYRRCWNLLQHIRMR